MISTESMPPFCQAQTLTLHDIATTFSQNLCHIPSRYPPYFNQNLHKNITIKRYYVIYYTKY
nr:MAG TPA: hypothetical protein [Caudoviricetes sp.]